MSARSKTLWLALAAVAAACSTDSPREAAQPGGSAGANSAVGGTGRSTGGSDGGYQSAGRSGSGGNAAPLPVDAGRSAGAGGSAGSGGNAGAPAADAGVAALDSQGDPIVNPASCPAIDPVENTPCPTFGLVCKYGDDPACRSRWGCAQRCDPVCSSDLIWVRGQPHRDCPGECPADEPASGDACSAESTVCTYGDEPACKTQWECRDGHWFSVLAARDCQSAFCPEGPLRNGLSCEVSQITPLGGLCVYQYGLQCACNCIVDHGDPGGGPPPPPFQVTWGCSFAYGRGQICPLDVPVAGTPCDQAQPCSYFREGECTGAADLNVVASCISGRWELAMH